MGMARFSIVPVALKKRKLRAGRTNVIKKMSPRKPADGRMGCKMRGK